MMGTGHTKKKKPPFFFTGANQKVKVMSLLLIYSKVSIILKERDLSKRKFFM